MQVAHSINPLAEPRRLKSWIHVSSCLICDDGFKRLTANVYIDHFKTKTAAKTTIKTATKITTKSVKTPNKRS